jgi:high affinity Mn2+ porin
MLRLNARTLKDRRLGALIIAIIPAPLFATLCLAAPQTANSGTADGDHKKVALILHAADRAGNAVPPASLKDIVVMQDGKKLQIVDGPKSAGRQQIALLLDASFHQQKVFALEQQTAVEMLSAFEKNKAQALVMSYGAEIHSSGELTADLVSLHAFTGSLRVETGKRNQTVLLYEAMKRAYEKLYQGSGTKAVVVLAEGNDYGSSINWKTMAVLAQRAHIACYFVLFADHSFYGRELRHYGYYLVELAPRTGGTLWEVGDTPRKARQTSQQLIRMLDSQGLLEVLVPNVHANRFHTVKVTSPGYRVTAQTGYFDDATPPVPTETGVAQKIPPTPPHRSIAPLSHIIASLSETSDDPPPPQAMFPHLSDSRLWLSGQMNFIFQTHPPFRAPYSGKNSLNPNYEKATSRVLTLYTGVRLNSSTELLVDIEESGGAALSNGLGVAGFPNLDIVRNPVLSKAPYVARGMIHKVFALSKDRVENRRNALSLFDQLPRRRLEIRFGKLSLVDLFDQNSVGSDPHFQFNNWAIDNSGAYDYAADTRGYTVAVSVDYEDRNWGLRFAEALMPKVANGIDLVWRPWQVHAENFEYELRHGLLPKKAGVVRVLAFTNCANMGIYRDAVAQFHKGLVSPPDITNHPWHITRKFGFGANLEQNLITNLTAFARFGWDNGKTESFAYTEVDQTFAGGLGANGAMWHRRQDRAGLAFVVNAISKDHRTYLADGGFGFLIGDGALRYGRENILEAYYTAHLWRGLYAAPGLQRILNPAYNRDRGPVLVPTLRLHLEL